MRVIIASLIILSSSWAMSAELKVGGGAAPINNIFRKVQDSFTKSTGITLVLSEDGPDKAIKALDEGKLDLAAAGLSQGDWLKLAEEKKLELKHKDTFTFRVIGRDLIRVMTHSGTGVKSLTKDQLKGLFTGQITNWKAVGGADQAVVVVFGSKITGTNLFYKKNVMDDVDFAAKKIEVGAAPEILEKVKSTPGAIGLAPTGLDLTGVLSPSVPEVGRPISVATKGQPSENVMKLINYVQGEGQKLTK